MDYKSLIWRKKMNGKQGLGLIPALLLFAIPVGVCIAIMWKTGDTAATMGSTTRKGAESNQLNIVELTNAANTFTTVKPKEKEKTDIEKSVRGSEEDPVTVAATSTDKPAENIGQLNDALTQAITDPPPAAPKPGAAAAGGRRDLLGEEGIPADGTPSSTPTENAPLVGGLTAGSADGGNARRPEELGKVVIYRRDFTAPMTENGTPAAQSAQPKVAPRPQDPPTIASQRTGLLPRGHRFKVVLMDNVSSLNDNSLVIFAVSEPAIFNGKVVLPVGTRLIGQASAKSVRDRMDIVITAVSWPDGSESALAAVAKDVDGQAGIRGYYIAEDISSKISTYGNAFLQSYIANKFVAPQQSILSTVGVTSQPTSSTPDPFRQQLAQFITDQTNAQAAELKERYKPYVLLVAGMEATVQVTAPFRPAGQVLAAAPTAVTQQLPAVVQAIAKELPPKQ